MGRGRTMDAFQDKWPRWRQLTSTAAHRGMLCFGPNRGRNVPSGQAGNYPVLLVDGVVGGVWHQQRSSRKLAVTVEPLRGLTATQRRQLDAEVDLLGVVMEATPTLAIGTVTVGAHA